MPVGPAASPGRRPYARRLLGESDEDEDDAFQAPRNKAAKSGRRALADRSNRPAQPTASAGNQAPRPSQGGSGKAGCPDRKRRRTGPPTCRPLRSPAAGRDLQPSCGALLTAGGVTAAAEEPRERTRGIPQAELPSDRTEGEAAHAGGGCPGDEVCVQLAALSGCSAWSVRAHYQLPQVNRSSGLIYTVARVEAWQR